MKIPEFDTLMFLPEHLKENPVNLDKESGGPEYGEEVEDDAIPLREDLEEDPFYKEEHKEVDFDDIQDIFKQTLEKEGDQEESYIFHDTVVKNVLDKFNSKKDIPEISGFLKKKSGTVKIWQKRYFLCRGNELCYFKSPKDLTLRGCINFDI